MFLKTKNKVMASWIWGSEREIAVKVNILLNKSQFITFLKCMPDRKKEHHQMSIGDNGHFSSLCHRYLCTVFYLGGPHFQCWYSVHQADVYFNACFPYSFIFYSVLHFY